MTSSSKQPTKAARQSFGAPTDLYQQEAIRQLSDQTFYTKVNKDLTSANQKIVKDTIQELITKQELPVTAQNLIINTPRTSCIYFKPKIHKANNPGRPILSALSCPTELISSYLDKVMTPIVKSLPSYVKDSNHALEIFRNFNFSGENKIIFTMDITSLYTIIPNNEGLQVLKYFFNQRPIKKPSSETLLRLAELLLTLYCFSFGDNYYKQINGAAMGTKMGPSYANLFVGFIESKFSLTTTDQNLIFTNATSMTASVLPHPAEKNLTNLLTQSILFIRL